MREEMLMSLQIRTSRQRFRRNRHLSRCLDRVSGLWPRQRGHSNEASDEMQTVRQTGGASPAQSKRSPMCRLSRDEGNQNQLPGLWARYLRKRRGRPDPLRDMREEQESRRQALLSLWPSLRSWLAMAERRPVLRTLQTPRT